MQNAAWERALRRPWRRFRHETNIRGGTLCRPLRPQRETKVEQFQRLNVSPLTDGLLAVLHRASS